MVLSTDNNTIQKETGEKQNEIQISEVKEKLQRYLIDNNSPKNKWLLCCHAHCFICLS